MEIITELLELIEDQSKVIDKQSEMIAKLTNENMEKENLINVLMQQK